MQNDTYIKISKFFDLIGDTRPSDIIYPTNPDISPALDRIEITALGERLIQLGEERGVVNRVGA